MWLLTLVVAAVTVFYIAAPLRQSQSRRAASTGVSNASSNVSSNVARLEARREELLRDLKDLEFDFRMQKFDAAEYAELRAAVADEASQVLQQLEAVREKRGAKTRGRATTPAAGSGLQARLQTEVEIEVMIARARRRLSTLSVVNGSGRDAGSNESAAQSTLNAGWRCVCGREMNAADRFCGSCGAPRPL